MSAPQKDSKTCPPCPKCGRAQRLMNESIRATLAANTPLRWPEIGIPICINPRCIASPVFSRD